MGRGLPVWWREAHEAEHLLRRLGHVWIVGKRRHLVLPQVQVAARQFVKIALLRHGAEYNEAPKRWPAPVPGVERAELPAVQRFKAADVDSMLYAGLSRMMDVSQTRAGARQSAVRRRNQRK
ncbi:hypothetical protein CKO21_18725 [Rhodovibrio salinarum]|uniref:Uncharacterized protein n=1 Tax=Rhodovibrio salinarum TaxID=1087 RepID=A0A934QM55_9PROT|nr:hypothetical protein [Rhodovibrio salinarum]